MALLLRRIAVGNGDQKGIPMLSLGALAFVQPWLLAALAGLPVLWWLLRVTPPAPKLVRFPPIALLFRLKPVEETPAHTPLWLILLRMLLAALVILALAQPLLNPASKLLGTGPIVITIDNGWAAARDWPARLAVMDAILDQAERDRRPVAILGTAASGAGPLRASGLASAADARSAAAAIQPRPWPVDRAAALAAIDALEIKEPAEAIWLSDGISSGDAAAANSLAERLQQLGGLTLYVAPVSERARLVAPPLIERTELVVGLQRVSAEAAAVYLRAIDERGRVLMREAVRFADGAAEAEFRIAVPAELRNRIARIDIEGETSAGATVLIDERWARRPVGLVSGSQSEREQPLLGELYYLDRALNPHSDLHRGTVRELLRRPLAVIALADVGRVEPEEADLLRPWVEAGGVLLRFAGPRLTEGGDDLLPVKLRIGDRGFGGAMQWGEPARLDNFDSQSPFFGLAVPSEVLIERQVLAEPTIDLSEKTWARLTDGTPLVTAEKRGRGWLVLVHTTANAEWSNLPLSGLFVEMLRRLIGMSQGVATDLTTAILPPIEVMDGFGRLSGPPPTASPIRGAIGNTRVSPNHPPGFYGQESSKRALNLASAVSRVDPLPPPPRGVAMRAYGRVGEVDLKPWLLTLAFLIALADLVIALWLRGLMPRFSRAATAALALTCLLPLAAAAQTKVRGETTGRDAYALEASLETRLAFVVTGVREVDQTSRAGLIGLANVLARRTSVEPNDPIAVDLEADELAFFPLLYWPVVPESRMPSAQSVARINAFMRNGGMIVFDTRDQAFGAGNNGPGAQRLRQIAEGLNLPPLAQVPKDHILTKAFYLIKDFPGRYAGGSVWVESAARRTNDGVSPVVIGSNDWAAGWAVGADNRPSFPAVPGGEEQREMAYRFGINLVMYALTGNYKADQVHVPAILERLGE
jgi:Domain of unknown function (DUF4159)/Aerotolerance regulator N-terminal